VALAAGTRIGPYEVTAQIGVGGMGEVWRATDTNLGRQVAIKVLPDTFAHDPERLARFDREARTLAALNHPNIAAIYGLERSDRQTFLVMELVEGASLADRIATGPIALDEALAIAKPIAEALEAAHEKGFIHRDLKPANIKLRNDGAVKVLDFGLAKAIDRIGSAASNVSLAPTITSPAMTQLGVILGTAAYMAPEQARGKPVDKRSDIWAFGCVLYEMLTGRRAFEGEDISVTLAAVLKGEPNWAALPAHTPPAVRRLLRRCLTKEPEARLRAAADAVLDLNDAFLEEPVSAPRPHGTVPLVVAGAATLVSLGLLAVAIAHWREPEMVRPSAARFNIARPLDLRTVGRPILSPDGRALAFIGTSAEGNSLFVRSMDSGATRRLANTERATAAFAPFWAPDSKEIAFIADQKLWRVQLEDGRRLSVADLPACSVG
jgi:eukaryotic-like serine/threonine-protein kinase